MIDLATEHGVSLPGGKRGRCRSLQDILGKGEQPSRRTILRWGEIGIHSTASGLTVHLEIVKIGGRLKTTREAVQRFRDAINQPDPRKIPEDNLRPYVFFRPSRFENEGAET